VVIGLRHTLTGKGIGLDNVCAGLQVFAMNLKNHIGTGDIEHVIIALYLPGNVLENIPAEVVFRQIIALNHRTVCSVEDQYFLFGYLS